MLADSGNLVRFRADGSRDFRFGGGGKLVLGVDTAAQGVDARTFFPSNIAMDGRGRLLVFGEQTDTRRTFAPPGMSPPLAASSALVLRFSGRGRPDRSFGNGRGFVRADFGLRSEFPTEIPLVSTLAGRVDSQDRPVLVAGVSSPASACYGHSFINAQPQAVVRLTSKGAPDPSFGGGDGVSSIEGSTGFRGLEVDAADQPLVGVGGIGGERGVECRLGTTLTRLQSNGERLATFGTNGVRALGRVSLDVLQPAGGMVLSQISKRAIVLFRLRPGGEPDPSFGGGGAARLTPPEGFRVRPVAVDEQGRLLLVGFFNPRDPRPKRQRQRSASLAVLRLLPTGAPDQTFGGDGWVLTPLARPLRIESATAALDPRGRLLVAGTAGAPDHPRAGFVLARYLLGP